MDKTVYTLDIKKFGINLNRLRIERNFTVEEFADKLSVSTRIVYDWESGKKYPTFENAIKIANLLRVSLDSTLL